jgi:hypothetical protein
MFVLEDIVMLSTPPDSDHVAGGRSTVHAASSVPLLKSSYCAKTFAPLVGPAVAAPLP